MCGWMISAAHPPLQCQILGSRPCRLQLALSQVQLMQQWAAAQCCSCWPLPCPCGTHPVLLSRRFVHITAARHCQHQPGATQTATAAGVCRAGLKPLQRCAAA